MNPAEEIMKKADRLADEAAWKYRAFGICRDFMGISRTAWLLYQDWHRLPAKKREEKLEKLRQEMDRLEKMIRR